MTKKLSENAVKQRNSKPGYGKPPKEHQWPPGQSGNPDGPPKHRTQLWVFFCKYMNFTDTKLNNLKKKKLTQSQQAALVMVKNMKAGKYSGSGKLARYVIDREEGKALETVKLTGDAPLSAAECDEIREVLKNRAK